MILEVWESATQRAWIGSRNSSGDRVFTENALPHHGKGSGAPGSPTGRYWIREGKIARRQVFMETAGRGPRSRAAE